MQDFYAFQEAIQPASAQVQAYPGWVGPAVGAIGAALAAVTAVFVVSLMRPSVSGKFRERVIEGKTRLRALNYQPALRELITDIAVQAQKVSPTRSLDAGAVEAIALQFRFEGRINALSEALAQEQELTRALLECTACQQQLKSMLVLCAVWLIAGLIGVFAAAAWFSDQPQILATIFVSGVLLLTVAAIVLARRASDLEANLERRLDWLAEEAAEKGAF